MQSKSFVAQLPALTPAEFDRLRAWGTENCSQSVLYRDASCCVVWHASRERARSREDFARAVRGVLKRLLIDASSLRRGRWLTLAGESVDRSERAAVAAVDEPQDGLLSLEQCRDEEDGTRVILIGRR